MAANTDEGKETLLQFCFPVARSVQLAARSQIVIVLYQIFDFLFLLSGTWKLQRQN